jgi:hypothetical protein
MNKTASKLDQLKIIIEKFLAWDLDCKDWAFEESGICILITLPILDRHNDYVQLYCRIYTLNETNLLFQITDDGFIDEEYSEMSLHSLFKEKELAYYCELKDFNEAMDHYFEVLRLAGKKIGFHKRDLIAEESIRKNEQKKQENICN